MRALAFAFSTALLLQPFAVGAQTASEDAAKALVKKAIAHIKKNGIETACADFANPNGGFIENELYVVVQDMHAKMVCHAVNPKLNGKDLLELKDADGKQFNKAMIDLVKTGKGGWVDYRWVNPVSKKIEAKSSYVEQTNDVMVAVGIYKPGQ